MPILAGCCCCDLKVGTKIIAILALIGSILNCLGLPAVIFLFRIMKTNFEKQQRQNENFGATDGPDDYVNDDVQESMEVLMQNAQMVLYIMYIVLGLSVLWLIVSSMLIHGVRKNNGCLMVPWILMSVLSILVSIALVVISFVTQGANLSVIGMSISFGVGFIIQVYFTLVVISQYQAIKLIRMHEEISLK